MIKKFLNILIFFSIGTALAGGKESLFKFLLDLSAPQAVRETEKKFVTNANKLKLGERLSAKLENSTQEPLKIDEFDLGHVCFGSVSNQPKLSGLHTDLYIGLNRRIIRPEDKYGISFVEWLTEFGNKKSTLFPHDWDAEIIAFKIFESLRNAHFVTRTGEKIRVIGETKENIKIESLLCASKGSKQKIATSFPRINDL